MNHSIFTKLLLAASDGKTAFPLNSGKNKYDFIEIHHFARQIATTLQQSKIVGIINCCTGIPVSLGEQVEQFIKEHHLNIHLKYGAFPDRPYDSPCVYGDPTAIRAIMSSK